MIGLVSLEVNKLGENYYAMTISDKYNIASLTLHHLWIAYMYSIQLIHKLYIYKVKSLYYLKAH